MHQSNLKLGGNVPQQGLFKSIRTKLIVCFSFLFAFVLVTIALINIFGVPFTSYSGRYGQRRAEAFKNLNLIADLKKERLLRWIEERNDDVHVFFTNELIATNIVWLRDEIEKYKVKEKKDAELWSLVRGRDSYQILIRIINGIRETYGVYNNFQVADAETGLVFVSTNDKDLGTDISQKSYFVGALMSHEYYITNIQLAQQSRIPVFYISHAIIDTGGKIVALMVAEVNAEDMLKPMLHTGEGLGAKGEALLVNQDVKILTSLKHPLPDKTYAKPLEYQIKAKPAALAASGEEGIIESQDYRGKPVLAAYRHIQIISEWGWGLVVKSDRSELFEPRNVNRKLTPHDNRILTPS